MKKSLEERETSKVEEEGVTLEEKVDLVEGEHLLNHKESQVIRNQKENQVIGLVSEEGDQMPEVDLEVEDPMCSPKGVSHVMKLVISHLDAWKNKALTVKVDKGEFIQHRRRIPKF